MHRKPLVSLLLLSAACATPSTDIAPQPTDFAVVTIHLRG